MSDRTNNVQGETERFVVDCIASFVRDSPANRLLEIDGSPIFEAPLVGFASGDDPLFEHYKAIIGPFHLAPREVLRSALQAGSAPRIETVGVVCWVLPIAEATRASNRPQRHSPSERWAHTRTHGERFNDDLRRHLVDTLQRAGHLAVAPVLTEQFRIYGQGVSHPPASTWSERHILYAAGMGTFGLSDGFITARGIAMRCGSVVCDLPLRPSPRRSPNHTANCLYLSKGACGACIDRCPAAAISPQGHDKLKCQDYTYGWARSLSAIYGVGILGCGLCQTGVPCEDRIPTEV